MLIPDRYKIGYSQYIARVVIFGVEYLILAKKKDIRENIVFWGVCVAILGL